MYTEEYITLKKSEWAMEQVAMKKLRYEFFEYPGPTQEELDKYTEVKAAWERYLIMYKLAT